MYYDLAVIGAGWAGFNASIRAKALGLKVALIEKNQIGGTCLNRGCIPTKSLIQSAKIYSLIKKSKNFGIKIQASSLDFDAIQSRKERVVEQLRQGMHFTLKGIDVINASAQLLGNDTITADGKEIKAKSILLACGSKPMELSNIKFGHTKIISSDGLLNLNTLPSTLLIIGGGVIGCEFAGLFCALGVKVAVVEKMPQLLPGEDTEVARKLDGIFKKKGISVSTDTDASTLDFSSYDLVLLSVGRVPDMTGLELDKAGVTMERNRIKVDEYLRTSAPHIFAAGDCTGKIMLAHFAAYQGVVAAENIAHPDNLQKADNVNIPNCIFTDPEIASVGLDEEEARQQGIDAQIHKFDFLGSGMARILDEAEGFIKIISNKQTGRIVGASVIGPKATELIAPLTVAVSNLLTVTQLRNTIFAHPTLSEAIGEAFK
jgi:dihydrolipoamide dehydrogenase